MSFLAPLLLFGLPLALIPVIIHLIHLLRRRQVPWAAMMFLRKAQKMNKGLSKLRQYLILAFRMLAITALILTIARPLAGGLLGLTGGAPDSVIVLLDRSASMEEQLLTTGTSKRRAGLENLTAAIEEAYGKRSTLVLIDSATLKPILLENAAALIDLPQSGPTETAADIPALMQSALDYMSTNETGRTDVWLVSDLRQGDWDPSGGRWTALRSAFSTLQGVRFHLLTYPEQPADDLSVTVENVMRRGSAEGAELLLDLRLQRREAQSASRTPKKLPLRVVVEGVSSNLEVTMTGPQTLLRAQTIPIDKETVRGWGRVELPADSGPANNVFHFVFDDPAPLKSVVVTNDPDVARPLAAALSAPANPARTYESAVLPNERAAEIAWEETAVIVWQAPLPAPDSAIAKQLENHLRQGRQLFFLPPSETSRSEHAFAGVSWTAWEEPGKSALLEWWRSDAGLLGPTRAGAALPVGEIEVQRWRGIEGETIPLARLGDESNRALILAQSVDMSGQTGALFLTTLPGSGSSTMARDGVVLYVLLHRALEAGATSLGYAQHRDASRTALGQSTDDWKRANAGEQPPSDTLSVSRPLRGGVLHHVSSPLQVALNRPPAEDDPITLDKSTLEDLFAGLDWRLLERTLENEKSLTSEVWRTFLILMAAAILFEALLCMPRKRAASSADSHSFPAAEETSAPL